MLSKNFPNILFELMENMSSQNFPKVVNKLFSSIKKFNSSYHVSKLKNSMQSFVRIFKFCTFLWHINWWRIFLNL